MTEISTVSIICVCISAAISVFFPIIYLLIGKIKMKGAFLPVLGAVLLYVLVIGIQAILWAAPDMEGLLVKMLGTEKSEGIIASIRCVLKALIETAGIWIFLRICKKRWKNPGDAITFGSGYAISACFVYSVLLVLSVVVVIFNAAGKEVTFIFSRMLVNNHVLSQGGSEFLYYGLRSFFDAMFYLSAVMMLFISVQHESIWPVPVVAFLNIIHIVPAALSPLHVWYWANGILVMITVGITSIISALIAYKMYIEYYVKRNSR